MYRTTVPAARICRDSGKHIAKRGKGEQVAEEEEEEQAVAAEAERKTRRFKLGRTGAQGLICRKGR